MTPERRVSTSINTTKNNMKFKPGDLLINEWNEHRLVMNIDGDRYLIFYIDHPAPSKLNGSFLQNTDKHFVETAYKKL